MIVLKYSTRTTAFLLSPAQTQSPRPPTQDSTREFRKVFVYAPPSAGPSVAKMLKDLGLEKTWDAEPVSAGTALRDSGLTTILEAALASARSRERYVCCFWLVLVRACVVCAHVAVSKSATDAHTLLVAWKRPWRTSPPMGPVRFFARAAPTDASSLVSWLARQILHQHSCRQGRNK